MFDVDFVRLVHIFTIIEARRGEQKLGQASKMTVYVTYM